MSRPNFLVMLLFEKYGQHQAQGRQAERFPRESVPLSLSVLADQAGAADHTLMPLYKLIEEHILGHSPEPSRRHHRAGHGQGQDQYSTIMGLRPRRSSLRRI